MTTSCPSPKKEMGGSLGGTPKSSQGQMVPKAASAVKASAGQKRSGSLLDHGEQPRKPRKIVRKNRPTIWWTRP